MVASSGREGSRPGRVEGFLGSVKKGEAEQNSTPVLMRQTVVTKELKKLGI